MSNGNGSPGFMPRGGCVDHEVVAGRVATTSGDVNAGVMLPEPACKRFGTGGIHVKEHHVRWAGRGEGGCDG